MAAVQVHGPWAKGFDLKLWSQARFSGVNSSPCLTPSSISPSPNYPKIKEKKDFLRKKKKNLRKFISIYKEDKLLDH